MASEVLMTISRNEEDRMRIYSEEKHLFDRISEINYARKEGFEEGEHIGLQKGAQKARTEERQLFLDLLNQGLSVEEIKQRLEEQKA